MGPAVHARQHSPRPGAIIFPVAAGERPGGMGIRGAASVGLRPKRDSSGGYSCPIGARTLLNAVRWQRGGGRIRTSSAWSPFITEKLSSVFAW